jgi:hypothetical protein
VLDGAKLPSRRAVAANHLACHPGIAAAGQRAALRGFTSPRAGTARGRDDLCPNKVLQQRPLPVASPPALGVALDPLLRQLEFTNLRVPSLSATPGHPSS